MDKNKDKGKTEEQHMDPALKIANNNTKNAKGFFEMYGDMDWAEEQPEETQEVTVKKKTSKKEPGGKTFSRTQLTMSAAIRLRYALMALKERGINKTTSELIIALLDNGGLKKISKEADEIYTQSLDRLKTLDR